MVRIHKEGYPTIAIVCIILIGLMLFILSISPCVWFSGFMGFVSSSFFVFIVSFFRVPSRTYTYEQDAIIAPADGKIVVIEDVFESEFLKETCTQISIFMSPLNVHVNRYPIDGTVVFCKYHTGLKMPAFNPKSSELNERTSIAVQTAKGHTVLFRQIAGAVARRIVFYAKLGDNAKQNEEFGFIKFGSRVDLFIPKHMTVCVSLGDKTRGGQTILAR